VRWSSCSFYPINLQAGGNTDRCRLISECLESFTITWSHMIQSLQSEDLCWKTRERGRDTCWNGEAEYTTTWTIQFTKYWERLSRIGHSNRSSTSWRLSINYVDTCGKKMASFAPSRISKKGETVYKLRCKHYIRRLFERLVWRCITCPICTKNLNAIYNFFFLPVNNHVLSPRTKNIRFEQNSRTTGRGYHNQDFVEGLRTWTT
jgi:hypothetical protein